MTPIIEDSILGSDLDGQFYNLLNVRNLDPVPANLVTIDDPRLSDMREPMPASIYDIHVAPGAAIDQAKLALTGNIPPSWLGTSSTTAARGDLVEYVANKNQPGGYAGLDATGKISAPMLPDAVGAGTVTSVGLTMPAAHFNVGGSPITTAGTFGVSWKSTIPDLSWFGNKSGAPAQPQFYTTALPAALIPNLNANQVTAGKIDKARLLVFIGVGTGHAAGAVPDPGASGTGTDYLARDRTWKPAPVAGSIPYQPTIPDPVLTKTDVPSGGDVTITATSTIANAQFFYSLTPPGTSGFIEFPGVPYISVAPSQTVYVYAARPGYNNSAVVPIVV